MKKVLMVLGSFIALVFLVGLVVPRNFTVEREIIINQPEEVVFDQLKLLKNHDAWSPWAKIDPNMKTEYKGQDGTVGFISSWSGNSEVGVGEQEIKNIIENQKIETELRFKEPFEATNSSYLITEAIDSNQTKVKWGMEGESPYPFNVICFVMNMPKQLGDEFEKGLNNLKAILEK